MQIVDWSALEHYGMDPTITMEKQILPLTFNGPTAQRDDKRPSWVWVNNWLENLLSNWLLSMGQVREGQQVVERTIKFTFSWKKASKLTCMRFYMLRLSFQFEFIYNNNQPIEKLFSQNLFPTNKYKHISSVWAPLLAD